MKRKVICSRSGTLLLTCILSIVVALPVFAADTSCKTKNPIIFTHGMAFTPSAAYPNSIPGIYEALTACGATVYTPATYAFAGTRDKANKFKEEFLKIQALYPAGQKFNIIGHSHGGLYTRDAITNLGLARYVASLTTVATPHRGSYINQVALNLINLMPALTPEIIKLEGALLGVDPTMLSDNLNTLSVTYMTKTFNPNTPNVCGIYYQSWNGEFRYYGAIGTMHDGANMLVDVLKAGGMTMEGPATAEMIKTLYDAMYPMATMTFYLGGGTGDGLVTTSSAKWGTFLGTQRGPWYSKGVNHLDVVNLCPYGAPFDVIGYWKTVVKNLKAKGY